ncbi:MULTISPECIES: hypothetical protein [Chromobacterium]|uniref:Uncharacterized protein n=1 Tax=Chromobacterium phragmitis TaxID=2202141 RepID=A0ABV0J2E5_9NEIS|nr:hypothetical protein [Chromobacterium sp. ASV23]
MPRNVIPYRDLWVAPGTRLYDALVVKKDQKLAAEIYEQVMKSYKG